MLQSIRDRSQGWLTWFIVITICITFALWGIHSYFENGPTTQAIATVNGDIISKQPLQTAYERLRQQQQLQAGANFILTPKLEKQLRQAALEQLIKLKVLKDSAVKSGYRVNPFELNAIISQIPAFLVDGKFSPARFSEVLMRMGYSQNDFIQALQADILANQIQVGFINTGFALPHEVEKLEALLNQRRSIEYTIISPAQFKNQIKITDKQLSNYYQQHQADFIIPEQVSVNYVELNLTKLMLSQIVTEQELKHYYQENINRFTTPARYHLAHMLIQLPKDADQEQKIAVDTKLAKLKLELKSKADFADLVKRYSDDVISRKHNGDLGWLHVTDLDPVVANAVNKLDNKNPISLPIKTPLGYEIIKLIAKEPAKAKAYDEVKSTIKQALQQQKAQQIFTDLSDKLANITFSNPDSLQPAANELGLAIQQTALFTRKGDKSGITKNLKVIHAAFNKNVLEGNNSDLIELTPGRIIVLRVKEHKLAAPKPYAEVKASISKLLENQAMQNAAKHQAEAIIAEFKTGKTTDEIAKRVKTQWHMANNVTRHSETPEMTLVKASFNMVPSTDPKQPAIHFTQLPSGDYAVIILKAVNNDNSQKMADHKRMSITQELAASYAQTAYQLYVEHIMNRAKIKYEADFATERTLEKN